MSLSAGDFAVASGFIPLQSGVRMTIHTAALAESAPGDPGV
jgi:hypothetical protein